MHLNPSYTPGTNEVACKFQLQLVLLNIMERPLVVTVHKKQLMAVTRTVTHWLLV